MRSSRSDNAPHRGGDGHDMKAKVIIYDHGENGISLFITPETDAERELLRGLWQHGEMKVCNGVADRTGQGFCVRWDFKDKED